MPQRKNPFLRLLVPVVFAALGLLVVYGVYTNTGAANQRTTPTPTNAAAESAAESSADVPGSLAAEQARQTPQPEPQPVPEPDAEPVREGGAVAAPALVQADGPLTALTGLRVRTVEAQAFDGIGSLDPESGQKLRVEFTPYGAGIESVTLAGVYDSIRHETHEVIQERLEAAGQTIAPMMAYRLELNGSWVVLALSSEGQIWSQTAPGVFEAVVEDGQARPVARVVRSYELTEGSFEMVLNQRVENLTDAPLAIRWQQLAAADMPVVSSGYGGEKRRVRFGYLQNAQSDPSRQFVTASDYLWSRDKLLGPKDKATARYPVQRAESLWPNTNSQEEGHELAWAALTNRYFSVVAYPLVDTDAAAAGTADKVFHLASEVNRVLLDTVNGRGVALRLTSEPVRIGPGASADLSMGVYAGPTYEDAFGATRYAAPAGVGGIIVYSFGGPCAMCTFQSLALTLIGLLDFLHEYVVFDWGLAIILLVVIVRTCLHPITRWSQLRMLKFGKQMQLMGPKQKKIQERYKDDRQKMQQEMTKLWREEGISPAGFLGCLPMFLQSPVWIALYASLFFAFELRQEPAFFGVFQLIGGWAFLGDLAEPDRAINFGRTMFSIPLMGDIQSINLLPLLLGVVFFAHQKYMTPPTSASLTPEQEQQQKMMRVMMVVMMPIFMYNAPSGLSLYFITNSTLGIFESRWIRSHAESSGMLDEENLKKKPRGSSGNEGFMQRLQRIAEEQQKKRMGQQNATPSAKKAPRASRPDRPDPNRGFKKR